MRWLWWLLLLVLILPVSPDMPTKPVTRQSQSIPGQFLAGEVRDEQGPVAGARVRFKGQPLAVHTDAAGRFKLPMTGKSNTVVAWKEGCYIASSPASATPLVLRLSKLPTGDNSSYQWVDPAPSRASLHNCGNCHAEIYQEWQASSHAHSLSRHFRNIYEGTDWHGRPNVGWNLHSDPEIASGVCNSCHAPTVDASADLRQLKGVAAQGVHCDYCHKIDQAGLKWIGKTHGRYGLKLRRPAEGQLFFGPLDDVDRGEDTYSPLYQKSLYCASCHEGTVFGVNVYTTYSEWLESPARKEGKQCQTCHMAPTGKMTNMAPGHGGIDRDPRTLGNHRFFAGSQEEMLRKCLKVEASATRAGDQVNVQVTIQADNVGHRVPTGFVDRNMILVVQGFAGEGGPPVPALSGPTLSSPAGKALTGQPGRLYAKQLVDPSGHAPVPFWQPCDEKADTRLYPGQPDRMTFTFPKNVTRIRVRVLYRKFWEEVAATKGWPDNTIVVFDRTISCK